MAQVEIISEAEAANGWDFIAQVLHDDGKLTSHQLRLAWADYNLWSVDGADEPIKVADAVVTFLLSRSKADALPEKFDAAIVRRRFKDADEMIPTLIGP